MMSIDYSSQPTSSSRKTGTIAHVLIADDDTLVTSPLRKLLSARGYAVTCVENGWDAAAALRNGRYDLLVADICMPGNNALDILHAPELAALQIPVIIITGHPSVETAVDALRLSVVDYFVKPLSPETFLSSVAKAVVRKQAMGTVREIEARLGDVANVLESVKSTLNTAGEPLAMRGDRKVRDEHSIRARLNTGAFSVLTPREREIITMLVLGGGTAEVATELGISVSTVRNHLKSIYRKLGVGSQVMLVRKLLA